MTAVQYLVFGAAVALVSAFAGGLLGLYWGRHLGRLEERDDRVRAERLRAVRERRHREAAQPVPPAHDPRATAVLPVLATHDMPEPQPLWRPDPRDEATQFLGHILGEADR
jgi:hypothetical protein